MGKTELSHSCVQQIVMKHLLCVRHCPPTGDTQETKPSPCLSELRLEWREETIGKPYWVAVSQMELGYAERGGGRSASCWDDDKKV